MARYWAMMLWCHHIIVEFLGCRTPGSNEQCLAWLVNCMPNLPSARQGTAEQLVQIHRLSVPHNLFRWLCHSLSSAWQIGWKASPLKPRSAQAGWLLVVSRVWPLGCKMLTSALVFALPAYNLIPQVDNAAVIHSTLWSFRNHNLEQPI